jgi:integrase
MASADKISWSFLRLMEQAGIQQETGIQKAKGSKGRTFNKLTFHSLRHGFVSRMEHNGTARKVRMSIVGHASESVHDIYTHSDGKAAREAIAKLPSVLQGGAL